MKELKFCYDKILFNSKKGLDNTQKAVWQRSKYWNKGQTIKVFFINGSSAQQYEVKQAFSEIAAYTSLKFIFNPTRQESDIRVSFNAGWGSYSYLGTDALFIPKSEETMNIGWRGLDVCRHEALHAIGALHEHQNPNEGIEWDEEAVIRDLSGAPNYWSIDQIRFNVLDKIDKATVDASKYDPDSIMLYYFPASWTKNGISSNDNPDFSKTDIEFMKKTYAITEVDNIAPVITLKGEDHLILNVGDQYVEQGAEAFDNKDGAIPVYIKSYVFTEEEGLYNVVYTATDKAGNKTEKIRTIMVQSQLQLREFLRGLFPTEQRLSKLTESQLVHISNSLGLSAAISDLKADTVETIWNNIQE